MKNLPKILVGGFPNSGTSFLCELVVRMGFSPGSDGCLKGADLHNPWGYWEHERIKWIIREATRYRELWHPMVKTPPLETLPYDAKIAKQISEIAEEDNVEVFKDTGLPIFWRFFPRDSKYMVAKRSWRTIWEKYYDGKYPPAKVRRAHADYHRLVDEMAVSCLTVKYEDFAENFDAAAGKVAQFIGVEINVKELREVFRK